MTEVLLLDLRRAPYEPVWRLQKRLVQLRAEGRLPDILIFVEHDHVYTMGRKGDPSTIPHTNIPIYHIERGGLATYHGPGQVVGYPIIHLHQSGLDVKGYLRRIEEALIRATVDMGIEARRVEGHTGVWVGEKKLASIGIAVQQWVTYHGFAYNVNTDLNYFSHISPCGLDPQAITSLRLLGVNADIETAKSRITERVAEALNLNPEQAESNALLLETTSETGMGLAERRH